MKGKQANKHKNKHEHCET